MWWPNWLTWEFALRVGLAILVFFFVWFSGRVLGNILKRSRLKETNPALITALARLLSITGLVLGAFFGLMTLGFSWKGAVLSAGITGTALTILVSFSAQTSISNLVSGFFVLLDNPFKEGDAVKIGDIVGIVEKIDTLSLKIRTFDNLLVRIPNTEVLNAVITNFTRYDIRRIGVEVGISYSAKISEAIKAIEEAINQDPLFLAKPEPLIMFTGFGDSSVNLKVMAWIDRRDYIKAVTRLGELVKEALESAGIEIPFPQIVVHNADNRGAA